MIRLRRATLRATIQLMWVALAACGPGQERDSLWESAVVAEVDGTPIHAEEIEEALRASRKKGVEIAIERRLAAAEADRRGLRERDPALQREIAKLHRQIAAREERLLRDALFSAVRAELTLPESQVREHYEKTKDRYLSRQWHFRVAVRASEDEARKLDASLGKEGRLDPASSEEIGPASAERLPQELLPGVRLKRPGDRAIVAGEGAWKVIELVDIPPPVPRTFEESREWVEQSLRVVLAQQAFDALMERLRSEADVRIDEAVLADDQAWKTQRAVEKR